MSHPLRYNNGDRAIASFENQKQADLTSLTIVWGELIKKKKIKKMVEFTQYSMIYFTTISITIKYK